MSAIAIMTDSNSGIMPSEGPDYGIHVLPMPVIIDGKTYFEGIDITPEVFYEKQTSGAVITTSQPSPGDVTDMWDSLLKEYSEIVFIPMSSGLSNTCQTAALLAEDEPYAGRVFVVDNHRISVTQSMSVLDAVTLAGQGRSGAEIKEILEKEALDATIYIAVDTLEYLKKGGRITPAAAALGTILKLKPVLTIQGDKLDSYAKARGMKSAFRTMLDALDADIAGRLSHLRESGRLKIGIANTHMDADKLENYKNELQKAFPDLELIYFPLTMSIGTHVGPGGLGIGAVRRNKPLICRSDLYADSPRSTAAALSAFFNKCGAAFRAAHFDLSFPFRDADLLLTGRACINVIYFPLLPDILLLLEEIPDPVSLRQEGLVFRITLRHISGKHPVITVDHQDPPQKIRDQRRRMIPE